MRSGNYLLLFTLFILLCCSIDGNAQIITTIAGTGTYGIGLDGIPATSSQLAAPTRVIPCNAGSVYIADRNAARVRKVDAAGIITTIAGSVITATYSGDGGPATAAEMNETVGIAMDTTGNIYIAEGIHVHKVNSLGIISTIVGAAYGYSGDGGPATAAQLGQPQDVAADTFGNLYIADLAFHCIRKIDAAGIITTVAGTGMPGYSGDGGPATAAQLHSPIGVTADNYGNLYIADNLNNCIRKVNTAGVITTVAGNDTAGYTGDGYAATAAELNSPWKAATDGLGNLYIADNNNNCIRKVSTSGVITTIAGSGTAPAGYGGDGGPASAALFYLVRSISLDAAGNIYIADIGNQRIRKITVNDHAPSFTAGAVQAFTVCENAGDTAVNALLAISDIDTGQAETWTLMSGPFHGTATVAYTTASTGAALTPSGLSYMPATGYSGQDTFTVRIDDGISVGFTTIYVTINPLPNPGMITGPDTVCEGAHITLSDTSGVGVWSSSGTAAAVSGGIVTGIATGIDTIGYTLTNGCGTTTAVLSVSVKDCTSAVSDIQQTNGSLTVYPNPASTELIITSTNTINQISISNILGQEITTPSKSLQNKEVWLNIAVLPAGVYFVKVNGSEVRRFVKE